MHALPRKSRRHGLLLSLAAAVLPPPALAQSAATPAPLEAQARDAIGQLQLSLQLALGYAMLDAGPEGAIETCNLKALPITGQISEALGAEIGRTALKVRNPENAADAWEREQLKDFRKRLSQGEPPAGITATTEDETGFRFMKAIPMQDQCVACHGGDIDPALQQRITALYPEDQATGFAPGELRGAFTVTIPRTR